MIRFTYTDGVGSVCRQWTPRITVCARGPLPGCGRSRGVCLSQGGGRGEHTRVTRPRPVLMQAGGAAGGQPGRRGPPRGGARGPPGPPPRPRGPRPGPFFWPRAPPRGGESQPAVWKERPRPRPLRHGDRVRPVPRPAHRPRLRRPRRPRAPSGTVRRPREIVGSSRQLRASNGADDSCGGATSGQQGVSSGLVVVQRARRLSQPVDAFGPRALASVPLCPRRSLGADHDVGDDARSAAPRRPFPPKRHSGDAVLSLDILILFDYSPN